MGWCFRNLEADPTFLWSPFFWRTGSIPELDPVDEKVYNTCTVYNPEGTLVAIHRKVHLFDIDIPGRVSLLVLFFSLFLLVSARLIVYLRWCCCCSFDDQITFKESETLTGGRTMNSFEAREFSRRVSFSSSE